VATTDIETRISEVISGLPGATPTMKLGHISFLVGKKVFACKRTMKEWAVVRYSKSSDVKRDASIFKEAMAFVAGGS
jgi:hypothetical protein